jgi:hypothetical protein
MAELDRSPRIVERGQGRGQERQGRGQERQGRGQERQGRGQERQGQGRGQGHRREQFLSRGIASDNMRDV